MPALVCNKPTVSLVQENGRFNGTVLNNLNFPRLYLLAAPKCTTKLVYEIYVPVWRYVVEFRGTIPPFRIEGVAYRNLNVLEAA